MDLYRPQPEFTVTTYLASGPERVKHVTFDPVATSPGGPLSGGWPKTIQSSAERAPESHTMET